MDSDYWKRAYADEWDQSSRRELELGDWLERQTHCKIEYMGLGTGSSEFIHGSAEDNGVEKGDPDLHVAGTNIYVEVTGPLSEKIGPDKPLWIRPDKLDNAEKHLGDHVTFIAHNCPREMLWRIIHVDEEFIRKRRRFNTVRPCIRGRQEEYVEIEANDPCVRQIDYLYEYIKLSLDDAEASEYDDMRTDESQVTSDNTRRMTPKDCGELSVSAQIIDLYLADVLGYERVSRRHYIGYCRSHHKMDVTLTFDDSKGLRVRMAKPLAEIRDSRKFCHTRKGNPPQPTEMILVRNTQVVYSLAILHQVGNE